MTSPSVLNATRGGKRGGGGGGGFLQPFWNMSSDAVQAPQMVYQAQTLSSSA